MGNFNCSTKISWGPAIKKQMQRIQQKKILLVCDSFLVGTPLLEEMIGELEKQNQTVIFSDIVPDPPLEKVVKGVNVYCDVAPDIILAVGGGSAIDTAKAIYYFVQELRAESKQYFIAVPTTSGTGSEVTNVAVVTDPEAKSKYPIVTDKIIPDEAWLDSRFVASCPASVVANSGLDVLTHALESLVATEASLFSDQFALKAAQLVFSDLEICYQKETPEANLMSLHQASCLAGLAFQNAGLGICHALSHQLGGLLHLPHGLLNAMLLPVVIQSNSQDTASQKKYADFSREMKFAAITADDKQAVEELLKAIEALKTAVDCNKKLSDFNVDPKQLVKELNKMVARTKNDFTFAGNPRIPTDQELASLILSIY